MCSSDVTALKPILYCAPPQNGHYISQDTFSKMLLEKKGTISDAAATNTLLEEEANYFKRAKEAPFRALQCSSCFQAKKVIRNPREKAH